jgi:hypothetical protein
MHINKGFVVETPALRVPSTYKYCTVGSPMKYCINIQKICNKFLVPTDRGDPLFDAIWPRINLAPLGLSAAEREVAEDEGGKERASATVNEEFQYCQGNRVQTSAFSTCCEAAGLLCWCCSSRRYFVLKPKSTPSTSSSATIARTFPGNTTASLSSR